MKVVFMVPELNYSGGPKMLAWVANQFAKENEVFIISTHSKQISQPLDTSIRVITFNYKISPYRIYRNTIQNAQVLRMLHKTICNINPDLIISFLYSTDVYYFVLNKLTYKRKMLVSQRLDPYSDKGLAAVVRHKLTELADGFVFQTKGARDFYPAKVIQKSIVIANPVTSKTLTYRKYVKEFQDRNNIIVLPARLNINQKRQDVMIDAFYAVYKVHPEMKLVLLGDGPDKELLKGAIRQRGLQDVVDIHASVKSAEEYICKCKIVAFTSDYEGIPNSLIEAMAIGINVVSADCSPGGGRTVIEDGVSGNKVP